jgi:hypothetical protein
VPQDVHSLADYTVGVAALTAGWASGEEDLERAGALLGAGMVGVSLVTDYRLSVAKWVPIEVHEVADHVWGLTTAAMPLLLGTWRKAPLASAVLTMVGLGTVVAALFTDYCAQRGVKWRRPLKTDPGGIGA